MTSQINKRNKKAVFDYKAAEEFSLSPSESPIINNSYYFSAHNEEMSIFFRVGNRTSEIDNMDNIEPLNPVKGSENE